MEILLIIVLAFLIAERGWIRGLIAFVGYSIAGFVIGVVLFVVLIVLLLALVAAFTG